MNDTSQNFSPEFESLGNIEIVRSTIIKTLKSEKAIIEGKHLQAKEVEAETEIDYLYNAGIEEIKIIRDYLEWVFSARAIDQRIIAEYEAWIDEIKKFVYTVENQKSKIRELQQILDAVTEHRGDLEPRLPEPIGNPKRPTFEKQETIEVQSEGPIEEDKEEPESEEKEMEEEPKEEVKEPVQKKTRHKGVFPTIKPRIGKSAIKPKRRW